MPTGKVKWFNAEKGFGFLSRDDGGDVFVHSKALPSGVEALKPGQRVEFGVVAGHRGDQALSVTLLEDAPSLAAAIRASVEHAWANPEDSRGYVLANAQEMDPAVADQHIALYVNEFTADLGPDGYAAVRVLLDRAAAAGLVPAPAAGALDFPGATAAPVRA